jgi:preprotein translocase subunit YajC
LDDKLVSFEILFVFVDWMEGMKFLLLISEKEERKKKKEELPSLTPSPKIRL